MPLTIKKKNKTITSVCRNPTFRGVYTHLQRFSPSTYKSSLQTRTTKLRKLLKSICNCCKFQMVFKNKIRSGNVFQLKDLISKDLISGTAYKFRSKLCNGYYHSACVRHLKVRIDKHIGTTPLTKYKGKPKINSVGDHMRLCNYSASIDDFSILNRESATVH